MSTTTTVYRGLCVECRLAWKNSGHCNSCGSDDLISVSPKYRVPRRTQLAQWRKITQGELYTRGKSMEKKLNKSSRQYRGGEVPSPLLPRPEYRELKRGVRALEHVSALKQDRVGRFSLEVSPGVNRAEVESLAELLLPAVKHALERRGGNSFILHIYGEGTLAVARGLAPQAPRRKKWWSQTETAVESTEVWLLEALRERLSENVMLTKLGGIRAIAASNPER